MLTTDRPLYFHHIPKTAGSSVKDWLRSHLGERLCPADVADHLVMIPPERRGGYVAFGGHFHSYLEPYLNRDLITVTVLREPISRTRSHWHQVRRHEQHPHHARVIRQSFAEFVMDGANRVMIEEFQARYLVRLPMSMTVMASRYTEADHARYALSEALEQATLPLPKDALRDGATAALSRMAVVGVTERLAEFLGRVAEVAGLPAPETVPRSNATERDHSGDLPPEAIRRLRALTRIDQELYDAARQTA